MHYPQGKLVTLPRRQGVQKSFKMWLSIKSIIQQLISNQIKIAKIEIDFLTYNSMFQLFKMSNTGCQLNVYSLTPKQIQPNKKINFNQN